MLLVYGSAFKTLASQRTPRSIASFAALGSPNPRITASTLLVWGPLSTPTLRKLLLREGFWPVIAPSLSLGVTPLIAPFGKPKTITSRVNSVVFAEAPNVASSAPCSCQAFLALTLLNVRAKAPLRSFLAPVIRSFPPG